MNDGAEMIVMESFRATQRKVSPLWDLRDYVAVNPFFGFRDQKFLDVALFMKNLSGKEILPSKEFFKKKRLSGEISGQDLEAALSIFSVESGSSKVREPSVSELVAFIESPDDDGPGPVRCISDLRDRESKGGMTELITKEVSRWASAYFDEGQAVWKIPGKDLRFFSCWKSLVKYDRPFGKSGEGFTKLVEALPPDPVEALQVLAEKLLERIALDSGELTRYFYGLIDTIMGWSSFIQKFEFEAVRSGDDSKLKRRGGLIDIVAIRMAYDISLLNEAVPLDLLKKGLDTSSGDTELRYIWLTAAEIAYRRGIGASLRKQSRAPLRSTPDLQAAFCIDVRSEVLRRHLELLSPRIQTIGFAGFFSMPMALKGLGHHGADHNCPVLLNAACEIPETAGERTEDFIRRKKSFVRDFYLRKAIQASANSGFSFMETMGFSYILKIVRSGLGRKPNGELLSFGISPQEQKHFHLDVSQLSLERKVNMTLGALKNMGLTTHFAKYVFFFGHGGESANNPYAAALDCGACGGHNGKSNARLLAGLLNEKEVRAGLRRKGVDIPGRTIFLSGWHNTAQDVLVIDENKALTEAEKGELEDFYGIFEKATLHCRKERAERLPFCAPLDGDDLREELKIRANDWSEIRPEWGLARNASFIIGRRELTRCLCLDGRSFLHDYDHESDHDLSKLELIMTAPMIVTNWINMQYYASAVDPQKFGAGNKVLNNVVGGIGCVQGNESDLLGGLTEQSVWYRGEYFHDPLRLQVFIEADPAAITKIIEKHQMVRELVLNNWMHLISIHPDAKNLKIYRSGSWVDVEGECWN